MNDAEYGSKSNLCFNPVIDSTLKHPGLRQLERLNELPTSATEITITIRNSEKTQKNKHLVYENYFLNDQDPVIKSLIGQALQEFNAEPEAIRIRANLVVL